MSQIDDQGTTRPQHESTSSDQATILHNDITFEAAEETVLDNATVPDRGAAESTRLQTLVPFVIEKGITFLDSYQVQSEAIEGGFGKVWRVHHLNWDIDLACKQPRADKFTNELQKENFIRECEEWMKLGLHPHIVSCYYVREVGGIPSIFSEWMSGGSLEDWIKSGRLYKGDSQEILSRILDIAIQFERGLHYAHEQRLIHQDVKPANLLLTEEEDAKVADFGIAKARASLNSEEIDDETFEIDGTVMSASGAYTPAYCSSEQLGNKKLTRRTDIYSWAATVLEMFLGSRPWHIGVVAGSGCEDYFEMEMRTTMPPGMKTLLARCLAEKPNDRPHNFAEIDAALLVIYKGEMGEKYPRPQPKAAKETAESLNNQALSYIDIGKNKKAEAAWRKALTLKPNHAESIYNQSLYQWRTGKIDDVQTLAILADNPSDMTDYFLAKVHLSRGDAQAAREHLQAAEETLGSTSYIQKTRNAIDEMVAQGEDGACEGSIDTDHNLIVSLSMSSDGKRATSGRYSVEIWNLENDQLAHQISYDDPRAIDRAALNPAGDRVFIGNEAHPATYVHDAETGKLLTTFDVQTGHKIFSPDGTMLAAGYYEHKNNRLILLDAATGKQIHLLDIGEESLQSMDFSPDSSQLLTMNYKGVFKLWNVEDGACLQTVKAQTEGKNSICFHPDGKHALTGGYDMKIKLWDLESGERLEVFSIHDVSVEEVRFLPDGHHVVSGDADGFLKLWDIRTKQRIRTFEAHKWLKFLCVSRDGRQAITAGKNAIVRKWRLPSEFKYEPVLCTVSTTDEVSEYEQEFQTKKEMVEQLITSNSINEALDVLESITSIPLFGTSEEYTELRHALAHHCSLGALRGHKTRAIRQGSPSVCFSPDGATLYTGSMQKSRISKWDVASSICLAEFAGHRNNVVALDISPTGKFLASGGIDKKVKLWDVASGKCIMNFEGHTDRVDAVVFTPGGKTFFSGARDATIKFWDVATGECLYTWGKEQGQRGKVYSLAVSPDGTKFLSGCHEGKAKLWDIETKALLREYWKDTVQQVSAVAFSPDGKRVISGHWYGAMKLWDTQTGALLWKTYGHSGEIYDLSFSPDGRFIVSSGGDNVLKLWNAANGDRTTTFEGHTNHIFATRFSPDGLRIASGSVKETLVHDLEFELIPPGERTRTAQRGAVEALSSQETVSQHDSEARGFKPTIGGSANQPSTPTKQNKGGFFSRFRKKKR